MIGRRHPAVGGDGKAESVFHHPHLQWPRAAAHLDLPQRKRAQVDPRMPGDRIGNHQLRAQILGHGLEAAGGVDGVADGGHRDRPAM